MFQGTLVDLPAIGPKDERALKHALDTGADVVAVSYVRTAKDLQPAKETIKKRGLSTWIVAKIEHPMALDHLRRNFGYRRCGNGGKRRFGG